MPLFPPSNPCRSRGRRTAFGLLTVSAVAAAVVIPTGAAFADPSPVSIGSKAALAAALTSAPSGAQVQAALSADLISPDSSSNPADETVATPAGSDVVLDLAGHTLDLSRLEVGAGATLEIEDTTSAGAHYARGTVSFGDDGAGAPTTGVLVDAGATFHADGISVQARGTSGLAGIGSPASVTSGAGSFVATGGAQVAATGGANASGIGGAPGAAAVSVSATDSAVTGNGGQDGAGIGSGSGGSGGALTTATTARTGSSTDPWFAGREFAVRGFGGAGGAGIGGGLGAPGAAVSLGASTSTVVSSAADSGASQTGAPSAVGAGQGAATTAGSFGSLSVGAHAYLTVTPGAELQVPAGATASNTNSAEIDLYGTLTGAGTVDNQGTISVDDPAGYSSMDGFPFGPGLPFGGAPTPAAPFDPTTRVTANVTGNDYLLTFDANGGTLTAAPQLLLQHVWTGEVSSPTPPSKDLQFVGWNTKADGTGQDFSTGSVAHAGFASLQHLTGKLSVDGKPVPLTAYAKFTPKPHFTGSTIASAGVGVAYDQPLPLAGDVSRGYVVVDTEDQNGRDIPDLPPGLSLDPVTHHVTGVPLQTGTFPFLVEVGTLDGTQLFQQVTMKIAGAPAIGTTVLPAGQQGAGYSTRLAASGDGAITWDLASGALPAGLALSPSGVISGTPTASGTATVTVRATSEYGVATKQLVLTVAAPAAAPAPVVAKPVLPVVPSTRVLFGHVLDLSVAASSTAPVTYGVEGHLPKGVAFDRATGLLHGTVAESGTFHLVVSATNSGGTSTVPVTVTVPEVQQLLTGGAAPAALTHAGTTKLSVRGFLKGEHFRVTVDGKVVQQGVMAKAGTLRFSVHLDAAGHDRVHRVEVTGLRRLTDPAKRADARFEITVVSAAKHLSTKVSRSGAAVTVHVGSLAAGEAVTVREGEKVLARGTADASGSWTLTSRSLARGVHHLVVTGATKDRSATITV